MTALRDDAEIRTLARQAVEEEKTKGGFTFWDTTDAGLLTVRTQYLRMIEDNPGRPHAMIDGWLASIRWVRLVRWCLHMRYGAVDNHLGTDSYDRYYRLDEPPTYRLAREMDVANYEHGRRHIIDWARFDHAPSALTWAERLTDQDTSVASVDRCPDDCPILASSGGDS